ncbi:MAG: ETX/MTX2 family pore-forming toxin [Prochloraceae cyanobacterium]|nr:ETX/MTX2 family pore-forming toxin [Prochloraceae cyanobacterium]
MVTYDPNIFAKFLRIGGQGGKEFQFYGGTNGVLLKRIRVWAGEWQIKAIQVKLTNGEEKTFGKHDDSYYPAKSYEFKDGERIRELRLWGNGAGTRCGAIEFFTTEGKQFFHAMTKWGLKQKYFPEVGSGICCGVFGRADWDIDSLGFVFLRPIKSLILSNVSYPQLNSFVPQIKTLELQTQIDTNNTNIDQMFVFDWEKQVTTTSSLSVTTALEKTIEGGVTFKLLGIVELGGKYVVKKTDSTINTREYSETTTRKSQQRKTTPPYTTVRASAVIREGRISVPYRGKIEVELDSRRKFNYMVEGSYNGVNWTEIESEIKFVNNPKARKVGLRAANGKYVSADFNQGGQLVANRDRLDEWETFELIEANLSKVGLRAANSEYVSADFNQGGKLVANRNQLDDWEIFELIELGHKKIGMKAANEKYVSADFNQGGQLVANREHLDEWEIFELIDR